MADFTPIQAALNELESEVTEQNTVAASAEELLNRLSALLIANAADPEAIRAIAEAITDKKGRLDMSNTRLQAAIEANTPAPPTE